jgi:tRNA threonylcarbamoyladenosine biosynthesis protein TsaB
LPADPILLALCSATHTASVALLRGRELVVELVADPGRHQAESLLPLVDEVLRRGDSSLGAVAGFALAIGPGSFTSLRVGLATVKGLAFSSDARVAAVSSLRAVAAGTGAGRDAAIPIIATLDARRDEVYGAAFGSGEAQWCSLGGVLEESVYSVEELAERVPERCLLAGEGVSLLGERLRELRGPGVELATEDSGEPRAAIVGRLGAGILAAGEGRPAAELVPRYVRRAEAEVTRTRRRFEEPS